MIEKLRNIECIEGIVENYKKSAKQFYFDVLFGKYRCPQCHGILCLTGPSMAACQCGLIIDPTIEFQRSNCCNKPLVKRICHYACTKCWKSVRSQFLFDERLFDRAYFREMVAKSRQRKRYKEELRKAQIRFCSGELLLLSKINRDWIDDFEGDLNEFVSSAEKPYDSDIFDTGKDFDLCEYWHHIQRQIDSNEIFFSDIIPLYDDSRKDRARCFVALVFMEHDRQVWMTEYNDDILVERYEAHFEG